jgi:hypothetical protein
MAILGHGAAVFALFKGFLVRECAFCNTTNDYDCHPGPIENELVLDRCYFAGPIPTFPQMTNTLCVASTATEFPVGTIASPYCAAPAAPRLTSQFRLSESAVHSNGFGESPALHPTPRGIDFATDDCAWSDTAVGSLNAFPTPALGGSSSFHASTAIDGSASVFGSPACQESCPLQQSGAIDPSATWRMKSGRFAQSADGAPTSPQMKSTANRESGGHRRSAILQRTAGVLPSAAFSSLNCATAADSVSASGQWHESTPGGSIGGRQTSQAFSSSQPPVGSGGVTPGAAGDSSTAVIVGSVGGALAALIGIAMIAMAVVRRRKRTTDTISEMESPADSFAVPTTSFNHDWENPQTSVITALTNFVPFTVFDDCGEGL